MPVRLSDGPPPCQLCHVTKCTQLVNPQFRKAWSWDEGVKWTWKRNLAYWKLCLPCHRYSWPMDHRVRNRYSKPSWDRWQTFVAHGKGELLVGDLYLTQTMPEFARPALPSPHRMKTKLGLCQAFMQAFVPDAVPASIAAQDRRRDNLGYGLGHRQYECEEPSVPRLFKRRGRPRQCGTYEDIIPIPWLEPDAREDVLLVDITFTYENEKQVAFGVYAPHRMRFESSNAPILCDTSGCANVVPTDPRAAMWKVTLFRGGGYHNAFLCRACAAADSWLNLCEVFEDAACVLPLRRPPAQVKLELFHQPYWPKIDEARRCQNKRKR